ncbi:MAG: beta strand repeat-containing protein [Pirellula sp.]
MTVQPDGKILVGGYATIGTNIDFAVARYNPDGSLDTSFGSGGVVTTPIGTGTDSGRSITLQADGKILVGGLSNNGSNDDFALIRYNVDGSLDTSFGTGGKVTTAVGTSTDQGRSVTVQPDGKILVGGYSLVGGVEDFSLVRYNANGSLDTSFGTGGKLTTAIGSGLDFGTSVIVQPDGKIVIGGYSITGNYDFAMIRYDANGSLDTGFGTGGKVTTTIGSGNDYSFGLKVQSDGKLVLAGLAGIGSTEDVALIRYNIDGSLDTSFGTGGKVTTAIGTGNDRAWNLAFQPDGKIVIGGYARIGSTDDMALVRYNANGSLDTSFGSGGKVTTAIGAGSEQAYDLFVQADGKIVVSGFARVGATDDFAVVRYNVDGSLDTRFDLASTLGGSVSTTENGSPVVLDGNVQIFDVELSSSNFSGATLTLARNGGANSQDLFSATGTLDALTQGSNLVVGGTTIGSITTNSGGTLVLSFNASATNALVNSAMQQIAYANSSEAPPANVQIDWTFSDGNSGAQGTGGALTATGNVVVSITSINDTPTITVVDVNGAVTEDATTPNLTDSGSVTFAELDDTDILTSSVALASTSTTGPTIPAGLATALSSALSLTQTGTNDGTIAWDFSLSNSLTQYLAAGETITAVYTITVSDDSGTGNNTATQNVTVVITGTNDDPIITLETGDSAAETLGVTGLPLTTAGSLSVADIDRTDVVTAAVSSFAKNGDLTGLTLSDAQLEAMMSLNTNVISNTQQTGAISWAFDTAGYTFGYLAQGESITLTYTFTVTDSQGATDTQDVVVTITGTNTAPDITVETGDSSSESLTETDATLTTSGTLSVLDINTTDTVTSQVSLVVASGTTTGLGSNNAALLNMLSVNANVINNTSEMGTINWSFYSGSEAFDYLAAGETLTLTYSITATDSQNTTDTQLVTITITGTNDEQVIVTNNGIVIDENDTNSVISGSMLQTTDLDQSAAELTYTVTSSPSTGIIRRSGTVLGINDVFTQSDINSGLITYDHDGSERFVDFFEFTVDDGFGNASVGVFNVTINPVNDLNPVIVSDGGGVTATLLIAENTIAVTTIAATDADLPVQTITYMIVGGVDASLFQIDTNSGELRFVTARDRENATDFDGDHVYEVEVQASDGTLVDTQLVRVQITDENEFSVSSIVDADSGSNLVAEYSMLGTVVGITSLANDSDATTNTVSYTLDDSAGGRFAIDSVTGVVTVAHGSLLDYEAAISHEITIRATSHDGSTSVETFTIYLSDVNEDPIGSISDTNSVTEFVFENSGIGSLVGITAFADDPDGTAAVSYTLDQDDDGRFAIDSVTGVITVTGAIDRETLGASRDITVRASSTDGSFVTQSFTIAIGDVNEFSTTTPVDFSGTVNAIAENSANGSFVGIEALAFDSDATTNVVTYTLDSDAGGRFAIDGVTGVVTVANGSLLNYEAFSSHQITVRATSADGSIATESFVISVTDVNEAPIANNNPYQTSFIDDLILTGSGILGNDFDPDGDQLSVVLITGPIRGTLLSFSSDGTFRYRPEAGFQGTVELTYLITDGELQSNIATVRILVVVPDNVPSAPNNGSSNNGDTDSTSFSLVTAPEAASEVGSETIVPEAVPVPVALIAVEQVQERIQVAGVESPKPVTEELKEGVLLVSLTSGTKFDNFEVQQTRFEHFEYHFERFTETSTVLEYNSVERRDLESQDQSGVQFSMDSALVRTVIGSGVVLMVMQRAQLAATLMAGNPTLMQFDPMSVMPGRGEKKDLLSKGEKLFDK